MLRAVESEILDDLPIGDPLAAGSRSDLKRLNHLMGHAGILDRGVREALGSDLSGRLQICELGAGDGTLLLRLARWWAKRGVAAEVRFIDRRNSVSVETRREFEALNWSIECVDVDVFAGLKEAPVTLDLILANLFLHHFRGQDLCALLRDAASRTRLFAACEPRRSLLALGTARLLFLAGCNRVTRHDAVVSVRAGFRGEELTALWPRGGGWHLSERAAGLFSHFFVARRAAGGSVACSSHESR